MNGFLKFKAQRDLEAFLKAPKALTLERQGAIKAAAQDHVLLFRGLSLDDLNDLQTEAGKFDAELIRSTKYEPLA